MEASERDDTQDWVIPRSTVPTLSQLEARIDEALVISRASEAGVSEVGEMALDAARQARRAAEAAESSARAAAEATRASRKPVTESTPVAPPPPREVVIDPLKRFNERADAISARLRELQRVPL
jgi:DNA-binding transcriptional LysR family regulator